MSRQEYTERISRMLDKISMRNLERLYYFISGWISAVSLMEKDAKEVRIWESSAGTGTASAWTGKGIWQTWRSRSRRPVR